MKWSSSVLLAACVVLAFLSSGIERVQPAAAAESKTPDQRSEELCVDDPSYPISFYGNVPAQGIVTTGQSQIQIFPSSDVTVAYLQTIENNVKGLPLAIPAGAADDPNYFSSQLELARQFASMQSAGRIAPLIRSGQFLCRGFPAGKYEFFATVRALGHTERSSISALVTLYYRASIDVLTTRKAHLLVPVTGFRLVGQVPK